MRPELVKGNQEFWQRCRRYSPGIRSTRVAVFCMSSVASGWGGYRRRSRPSICIMRNQVRQTAALASACVPNFIN